jgi:hypothetical protein
MGLQVRQRDERFPSEQPGLVKFQQPAAVPHADFTPDGAVVQLKNSFPGQEAHFMNKNFDMLKSVAFATVPLKSKICILFCFVCVHQFC